MKLFDGSGVSKKMKFFDGSGVGKKMKLFDWSGVGKKMKKFQVRIPWPRALAARKLAKDHN